MGESDTGTIIRMLAQPREETAFVLESERVICGSGELRSALGRIELELSTALRPCRIALLSDDEAERSTVLAAIVARSEALGLTVKLTRGEWGKWAREARTSESHPSTIHVLTAVPPEAKAHEGFAAIPNGLILLWPLELSGQSLIPDGIEEVVLPPFTDRPFDKAAHVVAAAADGLDSAECVESEAEPGALLTRIDAGAILAVCIDRAKLSTAFEARKAGSRLAEVLRTHAALRSDAPLGAAEVYRALCPEAEQLPPNLRRLWVEGDSDAALFQLTNSLLSDFDILQSIRIEVLGGAAQVDAALQRCNRPSKLELFLFDSDSDGRRAAAKVTERGFPCLLLDRGVVMAACDDEWVIEDLLNVACLDRFYREHPHLRPAREEIEHQPVEGRRLVVRGNDKHTLVEWLANNARLEDIIGVVKQLVIIRRQFSLRERALDLQVPEDSRRGLRPQPWWFI